MPDMWMDVDAALAEVPVNILPLIDDTDFKTRETGVTYDQAGMDLVWNFCTTAGAMTQTAVTPTTGGDYDWAHQGDAMFSIEIPASGGASINNDTEGFGWFTGFATGVLPWRGPTIGFRAAGLNNLLIDSAYSATRGLTGTSVPDAAADAAGGLPVSDAGGLDLDTQIGTDIDAILVDTNEMQGKLPTNKFMGSSDGADDDGTLNSILTDTGTTLPATLSTIAGYIDAEVAAILADTEDLQTQIGTAGAGLTDLGGMSTGMKAEVNAECDTALTDYDAVVPADLPANFADLSITVTTGRVDLNAIEGSDATTQIENSSYAGAQSALENNNLDHLCKTSTISADMTSEVADNTIISRIISNGDTSVFVPSTDGLQPHRDEVVAGHALLATPAQVNTEVSDVLKTDTISEMAQGAPPVDPTFEEAVNYIYRKLRNKTETTATEDAMYDDAGTAKLMKATISDDGTTFTKGEYGTGA